MPKTMIYYVMKEAYVRNYEEVNDMPRGDGTGPMGAGAMTGRCFGLGMFCRRGFQRFSNFDEITSENRKEILQSQKDALKNWLEAIEKQIESL